MSKFLPALAAVGALFACAPAAVAASPPPALDWQPCEPAGFECATAAVPRDYARPHGPTLDLALIRHRPATPSTGSARSSSTPAGRAAPASAS